MSDQLLRRCEYGDFLLLPESREQLRDEFHRMNQLITMQSKEFVNYRGCVECIVRNIARDAIGNSSLEYDEAYGYIMKLQQSKQNTKEDRNYFQLFMWAMKGFHVFTNFQGHESNFTPIKQSKPNMPSVYERVEENWPPIALVMIENVALCLQWLHGKLNKEKKELTITTFQEKKTGTKPFKSHFQRGSVDDMDDLVIVSSSDCDVRSPTTTSSSFSSSSSSSSSPSTSPPAPSHRANPPSKATQRQKMLKKLLKDLKNELSSRVNTGKPVVRYFDPCQLGSKCTRESHCNFVHDENQKKLSAIGQMLLNSSWKQSPCEKKDCKFGIGCRFFHKNDQSIFIQETKAIYEEFISRNFLKIVEENNSVKMVVFTKDNTKIELTKK